MIKDIDLNIQIFQQAGKGSSNLPEGWKGILQSSLVGEGSSDLPKGWKGILRSS